MDTYDESAARAEIRELEDQISDLWLELEDYRKNLGLTHKNPNDHIKELYKKLDVVRFAKNDKIEELVNNSSPDKLDKLANSKSDHIRELVAKSSKTMQSTLDRLVNDTNDRVVSFLAANANTSETVLNKLAAGSDSYIRFRVAMNMGAPKELLIALTKDSASAVSNQAKDTLEKLNGMTVDSEMRELLGEAKCFESFEAWRKLH